MDRDHAGGLTLVHGTDDPDRPGGRLDGAGGARLGLWPAGRPIMAMRRRAVAGDGSRRQEAATGGAKGSGVGRK